MGEVSESCPGVRRAVVAGAAMLLVGEDPCAGFAKVGLKARGDVGIGEVSGLFCFIGLLMMPWAPDDADADVVATRDGDGCR